MAVIHIENVSELSVYCFLPACILLAIFLSCRAKNAGTLDDVCVCASDGSSAEDCVFGAYPIHSEKQPPIHVILRESYPLLACLSRERARLYGA